MILAKREIACPSVQVTPGEPLADSWRWLCRVRRIIVHESVTTSTETTVRVLDRRRLGVHLIIGPDGAVTQHVDLARRTAHCADWNSSSIGIEIVNPYYHTSRDWPVRIPAPWADRHWYALPTKAQVEALFRLCDWLPTVLPIVCDIPARRGQQYHLSRLPPSLRSRPGFLAHHHVGTHADGAWPVLYCALRWDKLGPEVAYDRAVALATGATGLVTL